MGSWLADAVRYCFGFLGSRVSQGGLELTYGVAWGCFRAYFLDVFWKSISTLFRGCDWEWICDEFWALFWRPWPRFLASQWNFFGRRFGIFFFQNWGKSGSENGQDFCAESGHDFCPESGHRGLVDCSKMLYIYIRKTQFLGGRKEKGFWAGFLDKNLVHFLIQFWSRTASEKSRPRAPNVRQIAKYRVELGVGLSLPLRVVLGMDLEMDFGEVLEVGLGIFLTTFLWGRFRRLD